MRDPSLRRARLSQAIRQVLSELLLTEMKDPRLSGVVVSEVELSGDLKQAKAFFSVIGDEERERQAADGLRQARNFLRRAMGRRLKIHNAPELVFVRDRGYERADRIERLLEGLDLERQEGNEGDDES
jgi:ribosome-binding factor A